MAAPGIATEPLGPPASLLFPGTTEPLPAAAPAEPSPPGDAAAPTSPRPRVPDPEVLQHTGHLTLGLIGAIVLVYVWQRWGPGTGPVRDFAIEYHSAVGLALFIIAAVVGAYTIVGAIRFLREPGQATPDRLRAGYGLSFAAASLGMAVLVFVLQNV